MLKSLLAVSTLVALSAVASADDADDVVEHRDPSTAIAISAAATTGSFVVMGAGLALADSRDGSAPGVALFVIGASSLVVTPAMGHLYGEHTLLTGGTIARGVGESAVVLGGILELGSALDGLGCLAASDNGPNNCSSQPRDNTGLYLMGAGAAVVLAGTIYDIATAGSSTTHWNNEHQLSFAPTAIKATNGSTVAGFGLSGRF